jgi:hypothetical protein
MLLIMQCLSLSCSIVGGMVGVVVVMLVVVIAAAAERNLI